MTPENNTEPQDVEEFEKDGPRAYVAPANATTAHYEVANILRECILFPFPDFSHKNDLSIFYILFSRCGSMVFPWWVGFKGLARKKGREKALHEPPDIH